MTSPRFSILVPARQRPDTLVSTLSTLVHQPGDDYEIVVADNFGDDDVQKVVSDAQKLNANVRHLRSDRILPMGDNWERGLAACTGDYVTVLGDDDGFLPHTLTHMRTLINLCQPKVIDWTCHVYWWPDTIAHWHANRLYVGQGNNVQWCDSNAVLSAFFRGIVSFEQLPMIYSAFVHRDVISKAIDKYGCYFKHPQLGPDVVSSVVNLMGTTRYLHSHRGLTLRGNSKTSSGTALWARAFGKEQRQRYFNDEKKTMNDLSHPKTIPSPALNFYIANVQLHLKDTFFADRNDLQVDLVVLVKGTIANLNAEPESYDDNLADALQLAEKIGFKVDPKSIPPKNTNLVRNVQQGLIENPQSGFSVGVNCNDAQIFDVAGAARLAEAMSPPLNLSGVGP